MHELFQNTHDAAAAFDKLSAVRAFEMRMCMMTMVL